MIERTTRFGRLVFDRDAIVRAALRTYVEAILGNYPLNCLLSPVSAGAIWAGDFQRGAIYNDDGCGDYEVVAWTETGVVGLAYELGFGPIDQLDLSVDAVTGGPDDVRAAVPGLPDELEPAFVMAAGWLATGQGHSNGRVYGERLAGVGFWMHGDRGAGSMFDDPTANGANRLAAWGLLRGSRLPLAGSDRVESFTEDQPITVPAQAIVDAVTDRALAGPTELTPAEFETLRIPVTTPPLRRVLNAQHMLAKVGITWPGSPTIPEPPRRPKGPDPFSRPPGTVRRNTLHHQFLGFDRDAIVRAAKRACVEAVLAQLDPRERYPFTACIVPRWEGDLTRGAFFNGNGRGGYEVIGWTEAGVVGLAYQRGFGPLEQLGLSVDAVKGGPDDVRAALPELPAALEPALDLAAGLLAVGPAHGEKLASVGFWLLGTERVGGTLFDQDPAAPGVRRLARWGQAAWGKLSRAPYDSAAPVLTRDILDRAEPIEDLVEIVAERALAGPTELTTAEVEMLLPTAPDPERLLVAQRMLQKVGITWPGSPEIPLEEPGPTGTNPISPRP
ncbi:MAG: hypothetical protein ABJE95_33700 [Byssovorax sp.]